MMEQQLSSFMNKSGNTVHFFTTVPKEFTFPNIVKLKFQILKCTKNTSEEEINKYS